MARMHSERGYRELGWLQMQTPADYRKFAEECRRLAGDAKSERQRKILQEMAEAWRTLADETERDAQRLP
jgi:hypothetical protein